MGFSDMTFRLMELGAQLIAPLALLMGLAERVARSTPVAGSLARLFLPALGLIALVILGTDPLSRAGFSKAWPPPLDLLPAHPEQAAGVGARPGDRDRGAGLRWAWPWSGPATRGSGRA